MCEALLADMPMTAMLRWLGKTSEMSLLTQSSCAARSVVARLEDARRVNGACVHPIAVLMALSIYAAGQGPRGRLSWTPVTVIVDALQGAFLLAFGNVEPTRKRIMLAFDVSGSMSWGSVGDTPLTPRVAATAMAMITATDEREAFVRAFSHTLVKLPLSPRQRLDDVVKATEALPFGGTDCALPRLSAIKAKEAVDAFVVYTDSEAGCGDLHPAQALQQYREKSGLPARLVVVGMVGNGFTIADRADGGMLDVVGFDAAAPGVIADSIRDDV